MNIVYKITFVKRKEQDMKPYYYIGSKSNCTFVDGKILDKFNKEYWGSSTDALYKELLSSNEEKIVEVLSIFETYEEALNEENNLQKELDVIANVEYFNKGYASVNSFCLPDWGTYKHNITGKVVRLPINHELVLSGEYVGVTKGFVMPEDQKLKHGLPGELNPFYGKSHTDDAKQSIRDGQAKWKEENPERDLEIRQAAAKRMELMCKGVPKSEEHKKKIGRKDMVSYKNIHTGECIRMNKNSEQHSNLDVSIWVPMVTYSKLTGTLKKICCIHCGIEGIPANIHRWHNDNCKHKKENENEN